ncbi:cytochrome P450 2F3 [Trichonephila clavipes]|nr:cytochrome P450 2F3 [Trichonephila clavipes]
MACVRFKADHTTSKRIRHGFITVKSTTLIGLNNPRKNTTLPAIRSVEPRRTHIPEEASNFVEEVKKFKGNPTNISPLLVSSLNASIICLLIGRRLNKEEDANKIKLCYDYTDVALKYVGPSDPTSLVPGLRKFCEIFKIADFDRAAKTIRNFTSFLRHEIIRHKTSPALREIGDFINSYLDKISAISEVKNTKHHFSGIFFKTFQFYSNFF